MALPTSCREGCDLLSFYYLCRTGNNLLLSPIYVVMLWFAFILLSLSYWKQPVQNLFMFYARCDLLSFYYLCRTGNNWCCRGIYCYCVVICFHFTIFVVLETTRIRIISSCRQLWFAFILLSLSYWKQRYPSTIKFNSCCDLLSFYYLCRTGNNIERRSFRVVCVVICFHFTIFVVLETTVMKCKVYYFELWFAFILLSLSYWKQHRLQQIVETYRCDLLSFYYLCRTGNNNQRVGFYRNWLWFAFILLSLSYWKQPTGGYIAI